MKKKIIRITTVPISLGSLLKGQLSFMSKHYDIIAVSSPLGSRLEEIGAEENIKVIPVEMTRKITPLKDLRALFQMYRILRREKPFIVHSHTPKAGTIGMLAARLAGVPHRLHTIAGLPLVEARGLKRSLLNFVEKVTYACATKIYPNAKGLMDIIIDNNFTKPSKLKIIGNGSSNGIDTQHFNPAHFTPEQGQKLKQSLQIAEDDFIFIYVGRFVKDKGTNELLAAFLKINERYPKSKLLLVGGQDDDLNPIEAETLKLIKSHPNTIAVGWQFDVRPYFAIAHVLVFPSYREGFPNVVMQAGAMGVYAIVTDINGCNEIIIDQENGSIIPTKNVEAIVTAMEEALNNIEEYQRNREKYRKLIVDRYEQSYVWQALQAEYSQLTED